MNTKIKLLLAAAVIGLLNVGCRPKTAGEKVEDKLEDARHETGQSIERAGERIKESVK